MARENYINRIVIVGASGKVGSSTLSALFAVNPDIHITILSRKDSGARFPASDRITVAKGDYADKAFLQSVFRGQDLVLLSLSFMGMDVQTPLMAAAAEAGVKWILPTEYAFDGTNKRMGDEVHLFQNKVAARKDIEELAKTYPGLKWVGVVTNPWAEMGILGGMFGINAQDRKVTIYKGAGTFNVTTMSMVGQGIARLISLPITSESNPRASLQHYANGFVYLSSFFVTQDDLLQAVKKQTSTTDADWTVEHMTIEDRIQLGKDLMARGDFFGGANLVYAYYMGEGLGGNYEAKAQADRKVLQLPEENLDAMVKEALANPQAFMYAA